MLPRCSSLWLPKRLPSCGRTAFCVPSVIRTTTQPHFQPWNSTEQLFAPHTTWSIRRNRNHHLSPFATHRPSFQRLAVVMASHTHIREHSGPGGHHHHHHDNTYLVSSNKNDAGVRITRIGLFVNLGMAISKGIGGYVFHSQCKRCTGPYRY